MYIYILPCLSARSVLNDSTPGGLFTDVFTEPTSKCISPHLNDEYLKGYLLSKGRTLDVKKARINGLFCTTLCTIKSKPFFKLLILFRIWRKRRDSNSRTLSGRRFSRPVPSTARPRFQSEAHYKHLLAPCKAGIFRFFPTGV